MPEELRWPPTKEDLRRLYEQEKLSAARIAAEYGLESPNPKSKETLVLYYLRKFGIKRRDRAEHATKVTEEIVDEWVKRYRAGESLKQIAGTEVDSVTVWNHLRRRRVALRDKVEAQVRAVTKYPRIPFRGDSHDMAYLIGLSRGDFHVTTHGRAIRAKTSTTHPGMSQLFHAIFDGHGHVKEYPRRCLLVGFEWSLECDLDSSFAFLTNEERLQGSIDDPDLFLDFLSGFFDAEGSVYFHKKSEHGSFELSIANTDEHLLRGIASRLAERGFSPKIRVSSQSRDRGVGKEGDTIWRLSLWKWNEVAGLLKLLKPRHPEKIDKIRVALELPYSPSRITRARSVEEWNQMKGEISKARDIYVSKAGKLVDRSEKARYEPVSPY